MRSRLILCGALAGLPLAGLCQQATSAAPQRPALQSNRWQEDWSALSDPALRTEPLDALKYIALGPDAYASFGLNLRERFESNNASALGVGRDADRYLLQRLQAHLDLRLGAHWQVFTQLEDARANDKASISPADANRLDLHLAFAAYTRPLKHGTLMLRVGRQEFAFDLQRFVSLREGPNVRQAFDAAWVNYETPSWRLIAFASQPVQYANARNFDDVSNGHFRFDTVRIERHVLGSDELSAYYARYAQDDVHYLDAAGDERRDVFDTRFAGTQGPLDWDLELMGQHGRVGSIPVRAWATGGRVGYSFRQAAWTPRLGLQVDVASGDRKANDGRLETFNPLFPNGSYFTLAGYTGYSNLVHLKPALTVHPSQALAVTAAVGLLWRQSTADAVYVQPILALPNTAGTGQRWTGRYLQLRADLTLNTHVQTALELVHYQVSQTVRDAGGRDSQYIGCEIKFSW